MEDRSTGEEMVSELGIDPAVDVDADQRLELLRKWHKEDAETDAQRKKDEADRKKP